MPERAFPVIYSRAVEPAVRFYETLGFGVHFRLPPEGEAGYVGLRRGQAELAIVTTASPEQLIGVQVGSQPRFEMYVYVDDVDATVAQVRAAGAQILKEAVDMPWGERIAFVADADGNPVALAMPATAS